MFWLLIALNAPASICLEHSCRPMPCTLLHIIALNTFDWLFVVYSLTDDRIEKILQIIALDALARICLEHSCRPMPWTFFHITEFNTFYKIALVNDLADNCIECSCYWLHQTLFNVLNTLAYLGQLLKFPHFVNPNITVWREEGVP